MLSRTKFASWQAQLYNKSAAIIKASVIKVMICLWVSEDEEYRFEYKDLSL